MSTRDAEGAPDLVITGGTLVTADDQRRADIAVRDGKIVGVGAVGTFRGGRVIDATPFLVLPGLVDPHVHFGHRVTIDGVAVQASDDIETGMRSAAAGGTTTVIDFAVQRDLDPIATLDERLGNSLPSAVIDFGLHAVLTKSAPATVEAVSELVRRGVPSFKLYMTYRKQGRMADDGLLLEVLKASRGQALVAVHAENADLAEWNLARLVESGHTSAAWFPRSKPPYVEAEAIARALFLANLADAPLYVVHLSSRQGAESLVGRASRTQAVYAETCTHYLVLNETVYSRNDGHRYVCSPPLRTDDDIEAMWAAIDDGTVSVVSSDHCGFASLAKDTSIEDFNKVPNGLPGVGLRLPLLYTFGVQKGRISVSRLASLLSVNPARLFGLYPTKGSLHVGADADLVLMDPNATRRVLASELDTPVDWSPYEGMELTGWPVMTISRGDIVAENGRCSAPSGRGKFIERPPFDRRIVPDAGMRV